MAGELDRFLGNMAGSIIKGATDGPGRDEGEILGNAAGNIIMGTSNGRPLDTTVLQQGTASVQQILRQKQLEEQAAARAAEIAQKRAEGEAARDARAAELKAAADARDADRAARAADAKHPPKPADATDAPETPIANHSDDMVPANQSFSPEQEQRFKTDITRKLVGNEDKAFVHIDDLQNDPKFATIIPDNMKLMQTTVNGKLYGVIEQDDGQGNVSRRYITNDAKYKAEPAPAQKAEPVAAAPSALDKSGVPSDIVFQKDADPSVASPTAITKPYNDVAVQTKFAGEPEVKATKTAGVEDPRDHIDYTVKEGDSLWKIAREHYGLDKEDHKSIQIAVNAIAAKNGMDAEQANNIDIGQKIKLPDNPFGNKQAPDVASGMVPTSVAQMFNVDLDNPRGLGINHLAP